MSKKPVQPKEVWDALQKHPEFAAQRFAMKKMLRPYIEATPTVLLDLLDKTATVETLMKAKIAFLRYCVANGFVKAAVAVTPAASLDLFGSDAAASMMESALSGAIDMAEEIAKDVPGILEQYGMTERQLLTNPKVGLAGKALKLYDQGKLTVGEILRLQPAIIVKNT